MKRLVVEGWRFLCHSYALVGQWEALAILRRGDMALAFQDLPPFHADWQATPGMLAAADEAALAALPKPGKTRDATVRASYPFDFAPPPSGRLLVHATSETRHMAPDRVRDQAHLAAALRDERIDVLVPSQWSAEGFRRCGWPPARIRIVPHGVDPATFAPEPKRRAAARRQHGLAPRDFVFLSVGAMTGNKGIPTLLRAFARVLARRPRARLMLKGLDGLYRSRNMLAEYVEALPSDDRHRVLPRLLYSGEPLSMAALADCYRAADAYVSPYHAEGFNMPVLEAAACGLPVICTAGGPTDEFVTDAFALRIASRLVQAGAGEWLDPDLDDLCRLMLKAIDDSAWRDAARGAGPGHIHQHYTWDHAAALVVQHALAPT
jgi:glycosyltransferase involved in cell wall biosynthesis